MNKILIGTILVVILGGGVFYFFQKNQPSQEQPIMQQPAVQQSQTNIKTSTIVIQNFAFNPNTLTVKQGTKVTWINHDSAPHVIKSDTFNSSNLNQGDMFEFTLNDKGSFEYSCSIHPAMTGKIVVE